MSQLVTVTPKPGSRKFQVRGSGITQYNQLSGSVDPNQVQSTGEYKGQRFPNSRQVFRPKWSFTKRRWMLHGCDGSNEKALQKLNSLVKAAKLKYEENDPRYPGYITEADIFDFDDPFFKHSKLKILAREGEFVLDKDVPKDMILIMAIQASHQFAVKGEEAGGAVSNRVKYLITDKNIDTAAKRSKRNKEMEAMKLYQAMSDSVKMKVAMAMGLISRDTDDKVLVEDLLWQAIKNTTSRAANGLTMQDYFIRMAETTEEDINTRYLIQKARGEGHLKNTKEGWLLFGQQVGLSDAQVYEYFGNPDNRKIIDRLTDLIEKDPMPAPKIKREDPLVDLQEDNDPENVDKDSSEENE